MSTPLASRKSGRVLSPRCASRGSLDRRVEQGLEKSGIAATELLSRPELASDRLLDIKAIGLSGIKHEMKAQLDHQQRMAQQKAAKLSGVKHAFFVKHQLTTLAPMASFRH